MSDEKRRVIIADDSAIIRGLLEKMFKLEDDFVVVGSVSNGRKAIDCVRETNPDVVITDVDMPELDGIAAMKILTGKMSVPVVVFSEDASLRPVAIENGALLFETKPALSAFKMENLKPFVNRIRDALKTVRPRSVMQKSKDDYPMISNKFKIVCLGASTGGPTAVQTVLSGLGSDFKLPVLYTQHIDVDADKKMVNWFKSSCPNIPMQLAEDGMEAMPGNVYMAPAEKHLIVDYVNSVGRAVLKLTDEPPEHFLRPAVNKLFRTCAEHYKKSCLGILLTGMGRDGAEGCKMILDNGGYTIVEDKSTCAVFGMPAAAIELNAASEVLPRTKIAERVLSLV